MQDGFGPRTANNALEIYQIRWLNQSNAIMSISYKQRVETFTQLACRLWIYQTYSRLLRETAM